MPRLRPTGASLQSPSRFAPAKTLKQLAASSADDKTSYSGSIATTASVPEPSSLAIAEFGALGLIGAGLRYKMTLNT
jgi:hypothetical protein